MREVELRNQFFLDSMLVYCGIPNSQDVLREGTLVGLGWATDEFISKVSSVLKSLSRDWSKDGEIERQQSYQPIIDAIEYYLPLRNAKDGADQTVKISPPKVCVPGAGNFFYFVHETLWQNI